MSVTNGFGKMGDGVARRLIPIIAAEHIVDGDSENNLAQRQRGCTGRLQTHSAAFNLTPGGGQGAIGDIRTRRISG